jgi:hypothetical protein
VTSIGVDHYFHDHLGVDLSGIPASYSLDVTHLPTIRIHSDPITLEPITVKPLDVSVRIKEFPSIRAHVPALFTLGLSIFGYELVCARLCGEAQVITEPYVPNPCERCGEPGGRIPTHVPADTEGEVPR